LARPARRRPLVDSARRAHGRSVGAAMDRLTELDPARLARLQRVGILSGFAAGAWLGAAEAPTKLVTLGIPPVVISFMMVIGVFLARWSLPALVRGTAAVRDDVHQAPHLVLWAALAGCIWAVANTLTIFAIKDIGLAIAFPLWNANSLLGILWGTLLFNELRDAGGARWLGVWGGAAAMFAGATLLAVASSAQAPGGSALRGVAAALAAGALWGTMYIPYRKAYLTGMHPLSFVAFFTIGELKGAGAGVYWRVIGGSLLMAAGAGAIALATAPGREHRRWQEAGARESARYNVDPAYVAAGMAGEDTRVTRARRSPLDWLLVAVATAVFVGFAVVARVPALVVDWGWAALLTLALVGFLVVGGRALWRATRFGCRV